MEKEAWKRFLATDASIGEKTAAFVTANAMKAKRYFGMNLIN